MSLLYEAIGSATGYRTVLGILETVSATASATGITPEIAIDTANKDAVKAVNKLLNPNLEFYYNRDWITPTMIGDNILENDFFLRLLKFRLSLIKVMII
jgi:hypothetical protein